jgi:hypothetical protein
MCELWWRHSRPERDALALQSLPYLLIAALAPDAKAADIRRAYEMREALTAFDWHDPRSVLSPLLLVGAGVCLIPWSSIASVRALLPRCMAAPMYLRVGEGRQLLAFFFTLSVPLIDELFAAVKAQLPYSRQSVQEAYGDVLWHAWRLLSGQHALVFGAVACLLSVCYRCADIPVASRTARDSGADVCGLFCRPRGDIACRPACCTLVLQPGLRWFP